MANISLQNIRHSYIDNPQQDSDYALRNIDIEWQDGGAYALLGPSGCGKSTVLNLISGLIQPSNGKILFNGEDVTNTTPELRNIAQVFQFPVIYDTMTVAENLAFPLKNQGLSKAHIDDRVALIAQLLDIEDILLNTANNVSADNKQKISMGRGLVRKDVNVIMFDEPLTVIDPHKKWQLRSKLKELHEKVNITMIYVTHDQTEALTFAEQVVVMQTGKIIQQGSPDELFEQPKHTFVGHFIGSPGMNFLRCHVRQGSAFLNGFPIDIAPVEQGIRDGEYQLGIRPEFVQVVANGIPARVVKSVDMGRHTLVTAMIAEQTIHAVIAAGVAITATAIQLAFDVEKTFIYKDDWMVATQ